MENRLPHVRLTLWLVLAAVFSAAGHPGAARAEAGFQSEVPSFADAPVLYHFFSEQFGDSANLELVHEGKLKLGKLGVYDIDGYDWSPETSRDFTYWVMMENFWYLVPLMKSTRERDRVFVRRWLDGWFDAHNGVPWNNYGALDAMSAGFRVMTLVWYRRQLDERGEADAELVARIDTAITEHQEHLLEHYAPISNHGFWEAMGLFETTRIRPDSALVRIALERLDEMVALAVTDQGFYIERAPGYHFTVARWIRGFVEYLHALPGLRWSGLQRLERANRRINRAGYYLYDHRGHIPQIGDTDAQTREVGTERDMPEMVVDERVGYAVFKEAASPSGRYVVFSIPGGEHADEMPYHNHDDALAVYYSHGGEIVLGDQGRYTYAIGAHRAYIKSAYAHSTIVEDEVWKIPRGTIDVSSHRDPSGVRFTARFDHEDVVRVVHIPGDQPGIEVVDTISHVGRHSLLWQIGIDVAAIDRVIDDEGSPAENTFAFDMTTKGGTRFRLRMSTNAVPVAGVEPVDIITGQEKPMLGWHSPGPGELIPRPVIRLNVEVVDSVRVVTRIWPR